MSKKPPIKPSSFKKLQVPDSVKLDPLSNSTCSTIKIFNIFDYVIITIIALACFVYFLTYIDCVSWQLSSLGRIFLIKLLPYYDWRHLKTEQCLLDSWEQERTESRVFFNCAICENIQSIDVYRTLEIAILEERYINLDIPVILTSGLESWPDNSSFTKELKWDKYLSSSQPCKLSTNIFKNSALAGEILDRTPHFDQFFVVFQNCELEAMRALRRLCYRPDNIPPSFSPTTHNWLVWNKDYNSTFYKPVELMENLAVFGQLFGSTHVRLIPRKQCEGVCPVLNIELGSREMLLITDLWDLEYRTPETGENMAVIMEIRG